MGLTSSTGSRNVDPHAAASRTELELRKGSMRYGPGPAPPAEGLAEVLVVLLDAPVGSHIVQPEEAELLLKMKRATSSKAS